MTRLALAISLAAITTLAPAERAAAATFAPDMWVYAVVHDFQPPPAAGSFFAVTVVSEGTSVPVGCETSPRSSGLVEVECNTNPGIDLVASVTSTPPRIVSLIGFNETEIVCINPFFSRCPASPAVQTGDNREAVSFFDYATGEMNLLLLDDVEVDVANYRLSPSSVSGFGVYDYRTPSGRWDFGQGGNWGWYSIDLDTSYVVSGSLIAAPRVLPTPTPVPLPAGLPLLALGLAAFGLMRRRRG